MSNEKSVALLPSGFVAMSAPERLQFLRENADTIEDNQTVYRSLDIQEQDILKDELSELSIKIKNLEAEKKEMMKSQGDAIKVLKEKVSPVIDSLESGQEKIVDSIYLLFDQEDEKAYGFTLNGECVIERRLKPNESQTRMKTININK